MHHFVSEAPYSKKYIPLLVYPLRQKLVASKMEVLPDDQTNGLGVTKTSDWETRMTFRRSWVNVFTTGNPCLGTNYLEVV